MKRWSLEKVNDWYSRQPWLVGCNYIPATAVNQLEMWQGDTFDPDTIEKELGWAAELGFNLIRVFLHDLAYKQDSADFLWRMERFLEIADKYKIKPMFVFFDDVWLADPKPGPQPAPWPGVHNSGWLQSPGLKALEAYPNDTDLRIRLEEYVKNVMAHFKDDERILMWDLYNEPGGYWRIRGESPEKIAEHKAGVTGELCLPLLRDVHDWARQVNPSQPVTTCHFGIKAVREIALEQSDVITFHHYDYKLLLENEIRNLIVKGDGRPQICTEYMARPTESCFESHLPIFRNFNVGAVNWGFVSGKTQTIYGWETWKKPGPLPEPEVWFHDILRSDGSPYNQEEVIFIKSIINQEEEGREATARICAQLAEEVNGRLLRLEELDLSNMTQGWGLPMAGRTILQKGICINGQRFYYGVGTHAVSRIAINLKGAALAFKSFMGLDDQTVGQPGSVNFVICVDGKKVYDSGVLKLGDGPKSVTVDLRDAQRIELIVEDGGDGINYDHADWADAYFILNPDSAVIPESIPGRSRPKEIISPPPPDTPRINAAGIIGSGENRDFLYYVPVAGKRPMNVSVEGLPEGLTYDPETRVISGRAGERAEYKLTVKAENSAGTDSKEVLLKIGGGTALTPPMGWNSWNCWGIAVDEDKIKAAADALVTSGLIEHGWSYVNIDDAWPGGRDHETKKIIPNEYFPDMKALADYVHTKGLKFGLYTDVGPRTCGGYIASRNYEHIDARTYAEWGVDFVKVDWGFHEGLVARDAYTVFGDAVRECGRDIVYSICNWGEDNPWEWGAEAGGNLWRTTFDIVDNWSEVRKIADIQAPLHPYAGPGHWNDPDMLVVGKVGWGPKTHDSFLSAHQQYSHISLWCLMSAPLILGCDLTQLDEFTLSLLTNDEVLAINQDVLGKQAQRVKQENGFDVWLKDLADGSKAVGIFNHNTGDNGEYGQREYTLSWDSIGLSGIVSVRDLWRRKDMEVNNDSFTVSLPEYGASLLKVVAGNN